MEKMRVRKVVRNKIFIDIWKFLGIVWLNIVLKRFQNLKNVRGMLDRMLVLIYTNKSDIQSCTKYYGIKLVSLMSVAEMRTSRLMSSV